MKISFVEPHLKIYGGVRRIIELANQLTERGHDVTIFHSDGGPCQWMKCKCNIKSHDEVFNKGHDVLVYNSSVLYPTIKKAKARIKIYYVLDLYIYGLDEESSLRKELLKGINPNIYLPYPKDILLFKESLMSPFLKLSNSTWIYYWLKEKMNIDSKLLIGGINTHIFYPAKVEKNPNEIRILCPGDPRKRKGTKTILEAIGIVKREEPKIVLDTYHGKGIPQEKIAEKYSSADIFVEGSWQAGWNNPVAEAMACKVPVICTDIGGVKDFAFHEKTALLVPPKNAQAMALAILRLIKDEKLKETLRENAYRHIRQFEWDKSAERFEEIINSELSKRFIPKVHIAVRNPRKALKHGKTVLQRALRRGKGFDKYRKYGAYHWGSYYKNPLGLYKIYVNYILDNFKEKPKGSLLDVGCGDGLISYLLAENGFKVKGIDIEAEAIRLAQEKNPLGDFEVKDIFEVGDPFNYLLASEVIEHLPNPDEFLQKIKCLFRKEALITTPNKNYYKQPDPYHLREYTIYEFESLLEKHFRRFQIQFNKNNLYAWIKKG